VIILTFYLWRLGRVSHPKYSAGYEQSSQGRLPAGRSNRRQTTSQVAPLAASQASSDIQDGGADVQDDVFLSTSVLEWPDPESCFSSSSAVIRRPAAERPENANWVRASVFFDRGSAHLELTTVRRQILPYCGHLQMTPQDPSVQIVLTWRHQRLCIYGLYGGSS